jgi:hypothetical protein
MTKNNGNPARGRAVLRWLFAAAFVGAVLASGLLTGLMNRVGLFFLIAGSIATALIGFSGREIGTAFRHAAGRQGSREEMVRSGYVWEAAARNAWILGVLGSALNFTLALGSESGGIADIGNRMIQALLVTFYGLVLAVVCLVPAMKLAGREGQSPSRTDERLAPGPGPSSRRVLGAVTPDRIVGCVLFAAVLVLTVVFLAQGRPRLGPLTLDKLLFHGPAILVVLGGAIALALFMGAGAGARAWTLGFASTGLISLLMGLIQALFGFVHADIAEVSAAAAFIITGASLSLLGLVAVAAPLEDREVMEGRRAGAAPSSRMFWILLPLISFIFLILTFIMVVTPMTKPG